MSISFLAFLQNVNTYSSVPHSPSIFSGQYQSLSHTK